MELTQLVEGISDRIPAHAGRTGFAKALHSVLEEIPDVSFQIVSNAEAHSPFHFPRGIAVEVDQKAHVPADLLKRPPVTALVVCDLGTTAADKKTPLTKAYFRDSARMQALRAAVPQFSPVAARNLAVSGREEDHWEAELGKYGWVSVATTKERVQGTRKQNRFHIAVRATAGKLDQEYYEWAKSEVGARALTVRQLAEHPHTQRVYAVAKRNAQRIAYQAARALGVNVPAVCDVASVYANSREFSAPLLAQPSLSQLSNTIELNHAEGTATLHSSTTPATTGVTSHVVVLFNPDEGFGRFAVDQEGDGWRDCTEVYPVGMRKDLADHQIETFDSPPAHFVPTGQSDAVASKFAPSNRYSSPDTALIQSLRRGTNDFTHYKHVALLTPDPLARREEMISA